MRWRPRRRAWVSGGCLGAWAGIAGAAGVMRRVRAGEKAVAARSGGAYARAGREREFLSFNGLASLAVRGLPKQEKRDAPRTRLLKAWLVGSEATVVIVRASLLALVALFEAAAPSLTVGPARTAGVADSACAEVVGAPRPARTGELGFEERHPLLRQPENSWVVPGLAGRRAIVKNDSLKKPALFVSDGPNGELRRIQGVWASGAVRWSPEGTRLGVIGWKSRDRPWVPLVVTPSQRRVVEPRAGFMGTALKWSPDGRWLAVDGRDPAASKSFLWIMSSKTGACRILDSLSVFCSYEFGWSPDSKRLVVSRPSALSSHEDIVRADLWLVGIDGRRCRLTRTPRVIERDPMWIDQKRILYRRETTGFTEAPREEVITMHGGWSK